MPSPAASNCCATADAVEHGHDANTCVTQRDDKPVHRHQCLRCPLLTVVECVCVFTCNSTARGGTPFPLGRRADAQKGTYWGHINSPEMSPGDISPYKKYFANLIVYLKRIDGNLLKRVC